MLTYTVDCIVDGILTRCESLADFPHRGTRRDDIRPGLRTVSHRRRYTIGYCNVAEEVIVLGIQVVGHLDDPLRGGAN